MPLEGVASARVDCLKLWQMKSGQESSFPGKFLCSMRRYSSLFQKPKNCFQDKDYFFLKFFLSPTCR